MYMDIYSNHQRGFVKFKRYIWNATHALLINNLTNWTVVQSDAMTRGIFCLGGFRTGYRQSQIVNNAITLPNQSRFWNLQKPPIWSNAQCSFFMVFLIIASLCSHTGIPVITIIYALTETFHVEWAIKSTHRYKWEGQEMNRQTGIYG